MGLYEEMEQRKQKSREEPAYAAAIKAEADAFEDAASHLNLTCLKLQQISGVLGPLQPAHYWAGQLEMVAHYLTVARSQGNAVRRAAKAIAKRREREENGVFRV